MKITNTDSLKKNCDSYKVILKKQDLDIGLVSEWPKVLLDLEEIREYCYLDCISTFLLLHKVQANFILIAQKLDIILPADVLRRRYTASGIGFWFFVQGFFKRNMTNRVYRATNPPFVNNEP